MCYNAESSILSFIIGISSCSYLLKYGDKYDKHIGFYFIAVLLIQLTEFFMWKDQKCGILNHYASKSINLVLSSQVYFLILGFYLFKTSNIPKKYFGYSLIPLTLIYLYISFKQFFISEGKLCSKPYLNGSLKWDKWVGLNLENKYLGYIIYYGLFILGFLLFSHKWKGRLIVILGLLFILLSKMIWGVNFHSRFCFISAFIPTLFVILKLNHFIS
jgi:hypothetical protein